MKQSQTELLALACRNYPRVHALGNAVCRKKWTLQKRRIDDYELIFQYYGHSIFSVGNQVHTLHPGDGIVLRPGTLHWAEAEGGCSFYYVHFWPGKKTAPVSVNYIHKHHSDLEPTNLYDDPITGKKLFRFYLPIICSSGSFCEEFIRLFEKALRERDERKCNCSFILESVIGQILTLVTRIVIESVLTNKNGSIPQKTTTPLPLVKKCLRYIHNHFSEPLQTQLLAKECGITPQYLIRLFQLSLGVSPIRYCNNYRMLRAKDLLRESSMSIKEIAYAVGFQNPYYFSRLFKSIEGITPSAYRSTLEISTLHC